jgi:hypothetical protein
VWRDVDGEAASLFLVMDTSDDSSGSNSPGASMPRTEIVHYDLHAATHCSSAISKVGQNNVHVQVLDRRKLQYYM